MLDKLELPRPVPPPQFNQSYAGILRYHCGWPPLSMQVPTQIKTRQYTATATVAGKACYCVFARCRLLDFPTTDKVHLSRTSHVGSAVAMFPFSAFPGFSPSIFRFPRHCVRVCVQGN